MNRPQDKFVVVNRIVSNSPVVVFVWQNKEGWPVDFVSSNVELLMGYTPSDFVSGRIVFADIIHPCDIQRVGEEVARYSAQTNKSEFAHKPYRIIAKDGSVRWFDDRTSIKRDKQGVVTHFEGVLIDISEAKQTEALLRKNEDKYFALSQNIPGMIYRGSKDWGVEIVNNTEHICGYSNQELLQGKVKWLDIVHPDDRKIVVTNGSKFYKKTTSIVQEYRIYTKQNQLRFVSDHKTSRFTINGEFDGVDGIVFDVTARKRFEYELVAAKEMAEKNQNELKERVKELQGIFKLGIVFEKYDNLDKIFNEVVTSVIPKSMRFSDKVFASIEINGKVYAHPKQFKVADDVERLSACIYSFKQKVGEVVVAYTERLPFIDIYEQNLVELYAQRISSFTEKIHVRDELKNKNTRLENLNEALLKSIRKTVESEKKFKNIFDFIKDSLVVVDADLNFRMANRSFCKMFGYSLKDLMELNFKKMFFKFNDIDENFPQIFRGSISLTDDIQMQRKDESTFFAELTATHLTLNGESLILSSVRDITERKQMQQSIVRTIIETEEAERKRVAQELHDGIGPILSTIKLFTETYLNSKDRKYKKLIANQLLLSIDESLEQVSVISNNLSPQILMDFGLKIAIKKFTEKLQNFTPVKVDFSCDLLERLSAELEITVYRVVTELINNTIKYANATVISVSLLQNAELIILEYSDNGVGFDYNKTITDMNGMGLLNMQHRIKSFNGEIDFYSQKNSGVKVRMRLPYKS